MASDNIRVLGGLDLASTLSFEQNYSGFPADPKPRTLVVKEGMAYLYTELVVDSGYFTWTPIGLKQTAYLHTQGVASTTWTVTHDFGTTDFGYFVYDNNHHLVVASVTVIDENSVLINLSEAITGTAVFFSIQHVSAPNVTAVDSITINTMTLRDAIGVLTVNNNAVAMEESVASRLAQKYSTTQADAAIAAAVSAEAVLRTAADGTLSARIDSVLSNIDGTALNSLSEIVAAFQAADGTLNGAISSLGTNASSALGTEASTARAAEATLTANLASEVTNRGTAVSGAITTASGDATSKVYTETTRAIAAEATLTTNLGSEVSAARAAEATLTADLASEVTTRGTAVSGAITTAASDATAKVLTETNRATAAEGTLQGNITSEAATARAAESTLTTNLASEAATARAAESTLRADLASEVTNRGTAVSGAITTASGDATTKANAAQAAAASDATAKVLTETNRATAAEATIASNLASEITNRTSADATTLASAKSYTDAQINPTVKTYLGAFDSDILPSANVTYNLGSPTKAFHSVYVGPGTLYVNGKAVIEDVSDTMTFTTSVDQNIRLQTSGAGHLEFQSDLGTIDIKGTLAMESGKRITSSDGVEVNFGDDIRMNSNKITLLGVPTANADAATKAYVDSMTIYDTTIIRTGGSQTVTGVMTFDGLITGNLTVNGTTTTVNSETIKLADNLIDLNSNMVSGTPTENSGIRIMRGDEAATQLRWNEANDKWELTNDGSVYSNISTAADLSAEAATARAAESTLTSNLASEVTNRGTAVSGAITTASGDATTKANAAQAAAASDATAKVLTETNRATAAESTLTTDLASEVTNRGTAVSGAITTASGDATTKANAAQAAAIAASAPVAHVGAGGTAHANAVAAGAAGFMTGADKTKLDGIAAGATNVTNTNQITNGSGYVTASVVLTTAAQPNITSVGALTSLSTTGDVTVGGNLTVSGTTTTINATTLDVADINITIAKNAASAAAANGAGLTVNGAAATLQYLSGTDTWNFNKTVVANITGNVSGSAATITGVYGGSLTSAQVTTALTYTPYNSSNPSGYTTNVGTVTGVTATGPVVSSGGTAPVISMAAATASVPGYLTAADWSTFNGKQAAGSYQVAGTYVNTVNGNSGTVTAAHISAAATAGYGYTPYNAASIGSASVNYAASAGSAPASDVYAWAKAATKPAYNSTEVGLGNVNNTADSAKSVSYAATAGSAGSVTGGTVSTTSITTGGSSTAGTIVGNWSLGTGSKLNATYADLAEKYEADAEYEAGTVLEFGGDKEVSLATDGTGTRVAGVVSTNPAYVMNNECAGEHVAVLALQGRVPCKVIGPVQKGDLMVAARNGFACANNEARSGTIIGKALANFDGESGVIEVVVGRF